ncbi:hypothetical protein LSUB1_G005406 [Lachnellula subtilissima]|uniref:Myb-like domain-containing protein n=1 Tax=Lachnellula subtilissima TaxID=602034 RepID=A0A8H8RK71_9HELO|nr:hypothetical protein LSUB1_G005406 [Lachnellula subtilissima]
MLLPSAIGCDSSSQSAHKPRLQTSLFASPPLSPPPSSGGPTLNNLYSTCRALQSMLTTPNQLPSPPTTHAEVPAAASPLKLRLRARRTDDLAQAQTPRKKITKRGPPPRGINKRRRVADDDDMSHGHAQQEDEDDASVAALEEKEDDENGPRTPKRARLLAPPVLPLGLERGDFHSLLPASTPQENNEVLPSIEDNDAQRSDFWSTEEDRLLVELVLEKLKLTKSDWQDCARSLGKDRGTVGRRWKSLMGGGEVGLKHRPRRAKLHSTWR